MSVNDDINFVLGFEMGSLMNRFMNKEYVLDQLVHSQNKNRCIEMANSFRLAFDIIDWHGNEWCLFTTFGQIDSSPKANDIYCNKGKKANHYAM